MFEEAGLLGGGEGGFVEEDAVADAGGYAVEEVEVEAAFFWGSLGWWERLAFIFVY